MFCSPLLKSGYMIQSLAINASVEDLKQQVQNMPEIDHILFNHISPLLISDKNLLTIENPKLDFQFPMLTSRENEIELAE